MEQFIQKATNGQYSFDDINVDDNGKITGLQRKCKIMNSQEANAKYEEIRDNIMDNAGYYKNMKIII